MMIVCRNHRNVTHTLILMQMAPFSPLLFIVTAALLCGSLTGESAWPKHLIHMLVNAHCIILYPDFHVKRSQIPRKLSATSKWPVGTAPTSPSPGRLWMATTAPATSITSAFTSQHVAIVPLFIYHILTAT